MLQDKSKKRRHSGHALFGIRTIAILMSFGYAVALFHRTAFQGLGTILEPEFALAASESADLAAVFFWTYLLVMIPIGQLTDAIGARRVAFGGYMLSTGGAVLFVLADSVFDLVIARILIATGSATAFVSLMRFVAVAFPERKATYSGRGILVGNLGAIASGAPLVMLLDAFNWRQIWFGLGATSFGLAIALLLATPRAVPQKQRAERSRDPARSLSLLMRSHYIYLGVVVLAGLAGAFYAFCNLIGPRYLLSRGFNLLASGWQVSILILGYGLGAAFWGWIGDVEHQRTRALVIACCGALACWSTVALGTIESLYVVMPMFFLVGVFCGAFTLVYPLITERHPPSHAGGVIACVNCGIPLGAAVLQTVAGRVPTHFTPWLLVAAGCIALAAAWVLLLDRQVGMRNARSTRVATSS